MSASSVHISHIATQAATASVLAALSVYECNDDVPLVSIPRPEIQLVVRFGPQARNGLDIHAFGVRQSAHRKLIRRGQRIVMARFQLGAHEAVLGAPASSIAGRTIALEDLWGAASTRHLVTRLADASTTVDAALVLERAIAERLALTHGPRTARDRDRAGRDARLTLDAAARLTRANVNAVASDLGVSERHLRRVFREAVGVSPKTFTKLTRFNQALRAARAGARANWASIAATSGYYDQAHLIADFRAFTGVTPRALLGELRVAPPVG